MQTRLLKKLVLILPVAFFLFQLPAQAARLAVVGAANFSSQEVKNNSTNYDPVMTFGGGALLSFGSMVGLEFGALYTPRKYEYAGSAGSKITANYNMVQVPVLLRAYLGDVLSLGVGGYYGKYVGDISYETTSASGSKTKTTSTFAGASRSEDDYGLAASLGIYIPMGPMTRFVIDGRYLMGMKDQNLGISENKFKDILVLAGIQFGF